ncbi:uncharacterized protein Tco025E_10080 [Trypanosoma conorhini]|uniref:Mucin-like glycoprotein n=1 Tax=Trypanosoma conorhini TaxID=83891 RepID=A0A3R7N2G9_9TRYP|nr:uncharacterized protein Tco025E_10080 [Trypanosoma conorhini]RNE95294.1 hypothetical protein Tco025E_10080 [Trypanosoma conorhini]
MATMLAVRRRAVCALALLALLCGCGCGATGDVNVPVEVSCLNTNGKLSWRVAGGKPSTWRECPQAVKDFGGQWRRCWQQFPLHLCRFGVPGEVLEWELPCISANGGRRRCCVHDALYGG